MRIGVLFCLYGKKEYIPLCLDPWISFKSDRHELVLAASHHKFSEYTKINNSKDHVFYNELKKYNLNFIFSECEYEEPTRNYLESDVRNASLRYLLHQDCDFIILVDLDEQWSHQQINNTLNFIGLNNKFYGWFSINYKNYIFDGNQWVDGFCPPRIFKVKHDNSFLDKFFWDNDLQYIDNSSRVIDYRSFPSCKIPKAVAHIKHLTWMNDGGKEKVEYQNSHFGNGNCSYIWNEEKKCLEFNLDYFLKTKQNLPIIYHDE